MPTDNMDSGLAAERPNANRANDGKFWFSTDTLELSVSVGGSWRSLAGVSQQDVDDTVDAAVTALVNGAPSNLDTLGEIATALLAGAVVVSGMYDSSVHGSGIGFHNARAIGDPGGPALTAPEGFFPISTVIKVTTPFDSATDSAIIAIGYIESGDALANPLLDMSELDGTPSMISRSGASSGEPAGSGSNVRINVIGEALTAGALEFSSVGVVL